MPSYNAESVDLKVDAESTIKYEEVKLETENVDDGIVKKIKGYRVVLDMILYSYYINGSTNYGWQRVVNYQLRNNNVGDTHATPITGWLRPSADAADLIITADATYSKCLSVSDLGTAAYKYTYQYMRVLCAGKTYISKFYVKGTAGKTYKAKIVAKCNGHTSEETLITGTCTANWVQDQSLTHTVSATVDGEIPDTLILLLYSAIDGTEVQYAEPKLLEVVTGNQLDLFEFLYYYRRCNTFDKRFYIYPYVGGDNFWTTKARFLHKFIVVPDTIEVLDIAPRDKRLGQKIHLVAKSKELITREDLNYLLYRDYDSNNLYIEPYSKIYIPATKANEGIFNHLYINNS